MKLPDLEEIEIIENSNPDADKEVLSRILENIRNIKSIEEENLKLKRALIENKERVNKKKVDELIKILNYKELKIKEFSKKFVENYKKFMNMKNNDYCLEHDNQDISDDIILAELQGMNVSGIEELINCDIKKRNAIIKSLKEIDGVTVRQLSSLTGISKSTIGRIK